MLFRRIHPRQFNYQPKYSKQTEDHKIKFKRKTLYDPDSANKKQWKLVIFLIVILLIFSMLGGHRLRTTTIPKLETDNVINIDDYMETLKNTTNNE